jgi:GNAT superfamily N-acetyltransferase
MRTVTFREADPTDVALIAALHTESWRDAYRRMLPTTYLEGPIVDDRTSVWQQRLASSHPERQLVLLALDGDALLGFVCVLLDEEPQWGACLDNLHVVSHYKGQGLGRQLFAKAAQWVSTVEPRWPLHLWVFENNYGARRFYDCLGGAIIERQDKHIAGAEVPSLRYLWNDLEALPHRAVSKQG